MNLRFFIMHKVAAVHCAFIVLTLSMLAASGADQTVTTTELGFEITFPETWITHKVRDGPGSEGVQGFSKAATGAKGDAGVFVWVFDVKEGATTIKEFAEGQTTYIGKDSKKYESIEKSEVKLGDHTAYKINFIVNGVFQKTCYYVIMGGHGYEIYITTAKDDSRIYAKDIDAIVKSFKLIEAK